MSDSLRDSAEKVLRCEDGSYRVTLIDVTGTGIVCNDFVTDRGGWRRTMAGMTYRITHKRFSQSTSRYIPPL